MKRKFDDAFYRYAQLNKISLNGANSRQRTPATFREVT